MLFCSLCLLALSLLLRLPPSHVRHTAHMSLLHRA
jgi:hypothetical protein